MTKNNPTTKVEWNNKVKLIISDVDETIADNYLPADEAMIDELSQLLTEGKALFMISGSSVSRICQRIIDAIPEHLRKKVVVAHCSGAEIWGFDDQGVILNDPFYSVYDKTVTDEQKKIWRTLVQQTIEHFSLKTLPPSSFAEFKKRASDDPFMIMMEDRGPQITFEVVNGYELSPQQQQQVENQLPFLEKLTDFRLPIVAYAQEIFKKQGIPISPRLAGTWAIDFAIQGVNKTTAVHEVFNNPMILNHLGLTKDEISDPTTLEIWGDKFSALRGGTDRHICEALPKEVRAVDFRVEDPTEFLEGYNIVLWTGEKHLHHGLLEYLQQRQSATA